MKTPFLLLTIIFTVMLSSCGGNKEISANIKSYHESVTRLEQQLQNLTDTMPASVLTACKTLEDSLHTASVVFAKTITPEHSEEIRNHEGMLNEFYAAMAARRDFLSKLCGKRSETQKKSLDKMKYHMDRTEEAIKNMKPMPYEGFQKMQEDVKTLHARNKANYQQKLLEMEGNRVICQEEIKQEEELVNDPKMLMDQILKGNSEPLPEIITD